MKKVLLLILSLFGIFIVFFLKAGITYAQGSCSCIYSPTSGCGMYTNDCDTAGGYTYQCTSIQAECSPGYNSCTCVLVNPGGNDTCGDTGQPCCPPGTDGFCDRSDLHCAYMGQAGYTCVSQRTACCQPGGWPGHDCSGINCGGGSTAGSPLCGGQNAINTAIGCIPVENTQAFAQFLLSWAVGFAGGIAFVLMVYAGFMIITSAGNPQRLQAGKELLTAAIMGLVLILFGTYLLRLIGVTILNIPFFGR